MLGRTTTLVGTILLLPLLVHAQQIILCTDEKGRTFTADRPIPECQGREMRHYGKSANVVKVIPAPLTAEERRRQELEQEKKREARRAQQEQRRRDQALLTAFRDEDAIAAAREKAAAPLYEMIKHEKSALSKAEERRDQALSQLAQAEDNKELNASEWKRRADAADNTVKASAAKLQGYEAELAALRGNYDARIKRFRELKAEGGEAQLP